MAAEPCSAAIFLGAISEGLCREATEGISELPAGTWNLYQIGSSVFSIILPCLQIVHSRRSILAQKPRCPTGNARIKERLRVARERDLGFLAGERLSTCNNLPSRGSIRGIPRFSCQNLVFVVYFLREEQGSYRISGGYRSIRAYWPAAASVLAQCHSFRLACVSFFSSR